MPRLSFSRFPARTVAATLRADLGIDPRRLALRQALPLAVVLALGWLLWDRMAALDLAGIRAALATVGPAQWLAAAGFTAVSFWALGRYDAVVHRLTGTGVGGPAAVRSGATAIAVAQTLGMGAFTGAFVRWRMLPELSLAQAMRVSVIVALSFLAGWAVLAALAVFAVALPLPFARPLAALVLTGALGAVVLSLWRPGPLTRLPLPSLQAMGTIFALAALDTLAAGMVLWVLLPAGLVLAPVELVAAYLLALGAGIVLTTPGGVGPFEVALLTLLPQVPPEPLLAAVIAYRAIYYAAPALIGFALLARGPAPAPRPDLARAPRLDRLAMAPSLPFLIEAVIDSAPRAEAGLLRHGRLALLRDGAARPAAMAAASGQSLIALSDPLRPDAAPGDLLADLTRLARARFLAPVLYKSGARLALAARARGWAVLPVAEEAWLDPAAFSEAGAARRHLRRKLRKAEAAGLSLMEASPRQPRPLPLDEMAAIATGWAAARGGERGFSMGVWDPEVLPWSHVFFARDGAGRLLGFITVHANATEHTLDLVRPGPDAPDGLTYLLVSRAIAAAAQAGARRFSLASVPHRGAPGEPLALRRGRALLARHSGAEGLRQFKSAFAPHWEPLYLAAPSRPALLLGALDLWREIGRRPR